MKSHETRGVSFDVWKTLVKSNPEYKPARDTYVADQLSLSLEDVRASVRTVDVRADVETDRTGEQFGPNERLAQIALLHEIVLPKETLADMAHDIQELFLNYPLIPNEPNIDATLRELAKSRSIALTSNTGFIDGVYMRRALDELGILESSSAQIFSNELRLAKPDPRIFEATAKALGLTMNEIIHVGDNPLADYEGARRVGMGALLLCEDADAGGRTSAPTIKEAFERGLL